VDLGRPLHELGVELYVQDSLEKVDINTPSFIVANWMSCMCNTPGVTRVSTKKFHQPCQHIKIKFSKRYHT
jgi:hypothetical protein